jgi:hypothetical protein
MLITMVLTACSDPAATGRFELERVTASWSNGRLDATCGQRLVLSREARNALIHGVPLTVELELLLRDAQNKTRVGLENNSYEIRYLPLSDHYQLTGPDGIRTFPRLRHVLAELSELDISFYTGVLPGGEYELLARIHLDQNKMPPPMRLPVLLSAKWRHDSSWSSWPLQIEPGA